MGASSVTSGKRAMRSLGQQFFPPDMPGQFKLLVGGSLLSSIGIAMVFPFLTLYLNTQLGVPMDRVGLIFMLNAVGGLVAQAVAGPVADRFGRKPVMMAGLLAQSCVSIAYSRATTFEEFILLSGMGGFAGAIFMPASSAMVVDLVGVDRRAEAFGLTRIAANLGFVIGPSLGGLLATRSYTALFMGTAAAQLTYLVVLTIFAKETLPRGGMAVRTESWAGGYAAVLRDRSFMMLLFASWLTTMVYTQLGTTLPVHLKRDLGILENSYGLLMALNGGMVVLLQIPTTRLVERRNRAYMLALGTLCYAIGIGSMGLWSDYWLFAASMVVVTVGEMMIAPVSSAQVADLAPEHMRARYMGTFGLTWTISYGLGPTLGGVVMANLGQEWLWRIAFVVGCMAATAYLPLRHLGSRPRDS